MEITVETRSKGKQAFIKACATLFKQELKLSNSQYTLDIVFKKGLVKEGMRGSVTKIGPRHLFMLLDSQLSGDKLIEVLAHEMVHVKQFAKGQIKSSRRGTTYHWLGKNIRAKYYNQPWEIEAMSREKLLASKVYAIINAL